MAVFCFVGKNMSKKKNDHDKMLDTFKAVRGKNRPKMPRPVVFKDKTVYDRKKEKRKINKEEW